MANAAAAADAAPAPAKGKKKLIIIVAAVLVLALGGGGAFFMMKKKAHAEDGAEGEEAAASHKPAAEHKVKPGTPPTFVPLEPFVVNLADKTADRYAQIGITFEIEDPKFADQLKAYMPAIRSGILMVLASKTADDLLAREGKVKLAKEINRAAVLPLGIELDDEEEADEPPKEADTKKKKKKKKVAVESPITQVHFSNFIIQ